MFRGQVGTRRRGVDRHTDQKTRMREEKKADGVDMGKAKVRG
jgi:hypothetical protein